MIADAHNDLLLELAHREHRLGETNVFAETLDAVEREERQYDEQEDRIARTGTS